MSSKKILPGREASVIASHIGQLTWRGIGIFIILFSALLTGAVLLNNSTRFLEKNLVLVDKEPLFLPIYLSGVVLSIFIGLLASMRVARELDKGTLELLFYGPVESRQYLSGVAIGYMGIGLASVLVILFWAKLSEMLLNLAPDAKLFGLLLSVFLMICAFLALSLLIAILGGKARNAIAYFVLAVFLLLSFQIGDSLLSTLLLGGSATATDALSLVRKILYSVNEVLRWLSPFQITFEAAQNLNHGAITKYLIGNILLIAETLILMTFAILRLAGKGVRGER